LGLGCPGEAKSELERLAKRLRNHPEVLDVRWMIHAHEEDWSAALQVARELVLKAPGMPGSWLHQAYALRRVPEGGLQAAWDVLFPAMDQFPKDSIIPYNLACYACQLGQPDKARILLRRAMALGDRDRINRMALNDPDLKPLWNELGSN